MMSRLSTALRELFARRPDPATVYPYALLVGLVVAVVVIGALIVANQLRAL